MLKASVIVGMEAAMKLLVRIALIASLLLAASASANEANKEVNYIPVKPSFVTNFISGGNRLAYLKIDVSIRVELLEHTEPVERHRPQIRDRLLMFFSHQTVESINSPEGRQELRTQALQIVQEVLTEEEGVPMATDLLFDNFIVQG